MAREADAEQCLAIYAPFCLEDSHVSFEIVPPSLEEMRGRIARTLRQNPWLVCEQDGVILGYSYAGPHSERAAYRWSVNAAIYVREGRRGSGLGRALYTSLFSILRLQGYFNAYAGITLPNPASEGLHRAMGFEPVGVYKKVGYKCGSWHDTLWLQFPLREHRDDPESPRGIHQVVGGPGWDEALASGVPWLRVESAPERLGPLGGRGRGDSADPSATGIVDD